MKKTPPKKTLKPTKGSVSSSMRRADRTPGSMLVPEASSVAPLFERIVEILENARAGVVRSINSAMVCAYWNIGRELVEYVQDGNQRAEYGERIVDELSRRLTQHVGRGYSTTNLRYFRSFYLAYADRRPEIRHITGGESSPSPGAGDERAICRTTPGCW